MSPSGISVAAGASLCLARTLKAHPRGRDAALMSELFISLSAVCFPLVEGQSEHFVGTRTRQIHRRKAENVPPFSAWSELQSYLPWRPHSWPRVDPPSLVPTQLQVWPFLTLSSMAVWYCMSSLPLLPADNSEKYTQTAEELSGELLKRLCLWS